MSDARIIVGLHSVRMALKQDASTVLELWVESRRHDRRIREILQLARETGTPVIQATREALDERVPESNHQGVVARTRMPAAWDEMALKKYLGRLEEAPLLLILDGVQDPHNLGACLRSADAAGVHAVIAPKDRSAGVGPTVCKVASGAAESVPFVQVTNLARTLRWLRDERGIWLVGMAGEADLNLYEVRLKGPLAMLMGGEGKGLRRLTRDACDVLARLPMAGVVESLNVSVATGICLFEAVRQRAE